MGGEKILADTFTAHGEHTDRQYDSRSDFHSKVATWCLLFDLLKHSQQGPGGPYGLWDDVAAGRLGFRLNHRLVGTAMSKKLDLVVCEVAGNSRRGTHFLDVGARLGVRVDNPADEAYCRSLAQVGFHEVDKDHVGNARIVVEAKAAMSDLVAAMPRLYAEILATGIVARDAQLARGWRRTVVASLNLVNTSASFRSSTRDEPKVNSAGSALKVINMLANAFRVGLVSKAFDGRDVFDAVGITPIVCANDMTTPVRIDTSARVPDQARYDQMVQDICNKYG